MASSEDTPAHASEHHLRFHSSHTHLSSVFGSDWFGTRAEKFARFFGTPTCLIAQTVVVGVWIALNAANVTHFDVYPFILLNLAFSLQAAYAAPLILLAQTRQADRDKALADADARHREDLARRVGMRLAVVRQRHGALQHHRAHVERMAVLGIDLGAGRRIGHDVVAVALEL